MSKLWLMLRTAWHFRRADLAVLLGIAVSTAVLTGALMVGDSVRGSLRDLAVQRLGPVDYALAGPKFFPEDLGRRLAAHEQFQQAGFKQCVAGVSIRGGAMDEATQARSARVNIAALSDWVEAEPGKCIINDQLAEALNAGNKASALVLTLPAVDDTPRDATFTPRGREDVTSGLRAEVSRVDRSAGMVSLFDLSPSQRTPRNAWVNLRELQNAVEQPGQANLLLVSADGGSDESKLNELLRRQMTLADYGLATTPSDDGKEAVIWSKSTFIPVPAQRAAERASDRTGTPVRQVMVYLVNNVVRLGAGERQAATIHYAIVAGMDRLDGADLADNEVALNAWTAEQLGARVGDHIRLDYYQRQENGDLREVQGAEVFTVARVLPMEGIGADPTLTPEFKGLTDADTIAAWEPPAGLTIDKKLVTDADETYWRDHKAAPKVFMSLRAARKMWGQVWGDVTSLRVPAGNARAFAAALRDEINPAELGLSFMPIRRQQLASASGSTEFSGLFIGFSFFLIVAAVLLTAMLLRLNVEQRARQYGLLSAVGFTPAALRRMALAEGMVLAVLGAALGTPAAVGYTALMVFGLRTRWVDAVGTTAIALHVEPFTLAMGFLASLVIAFLAILWACWRLARTQASRLLAGGWSMGSGRREGRPRLAAMTAAGGIGCGLVLMGLGVMHLVPMQAAFMGGGFALLVGVLAAGAYWLQARPAGSAQWLSILRLALRNAGRYPARSLLSVGLIAFASFVLVTVASMRQEPVSDTHEKASGAGGYQLIVEADVPLTGDPGTEKGREVLGVAEVDSPLWNGAKFTPLRSWAGQDISCLNLTRATSPTILGVPQSMVERNAFAFARTIENATNPWELLNRQESDADVVPVIADEETARWILKLGPGELMPIQDQLGRARRLKLVATLKGSIFQSELLMGEANFLRLFPSQAGYGVVLVEAADADLTALTQLLGAELADFSATIERTSERLSRYLQVANTYLSTFQLLGSLGLMLGTIGLAVVLVRSVVERRGELALLAALGFSKSSRVGLVLSENAALLVLGLVLGTATSLVGILPVVLSAQRAINFADLAVTLGTVLAIGLAVLALAVGVSRRVRPADLRQE